MNLKRIVAGPLLALVFIVFFAYMISNLQWIYNGYLQPKIKDVSTAGISASTQNIITTSEPSVDKNFVMPNSGPVVTEPIITKGAETKINAKSAVSIESNLSGQKKIIFEKNADAILPIASLTKFMTAIIVLDNYNLSDTWTVSELAGEQASAGQDVKLGDKMIVDSFLQIMLIESSNRSAYALSEIIGTQKFVELMNIKAKELGLENTSFEDPTGISSKNLSTAKDLAKLTEYILKNYPKIADISKSKELYIMGFGRVVNTDQLLGEIPEIVCSKTGFTTSAKGCLLLAISNPKNNDYFINIVLGADERFSEMKKLINLSNAICE
jgi:D-alanyl-D-alanine carboxypeptidase